MLVRGIDYIHVQCDLRNALCLPKALFCNIRLLHSKIDLIYVRDMIFEMHNVIKDQPLRLAHWMVAVYLLAWWYLLQMSTFNVIHHVGRALVTECPAAVRQALIANIDWALGLLADKRE
jgi:hypothetical protein